MVYRIEPLNIYHLVVSTKSIYESSKGLMVMLLKDVMTKPLIWQAINTLNAVSATLEQIKAEMLQPASQLSEFSVVTTMFDVKNSLGPQIMVKIGDVSRFARKSAITFFAGVHPGANQSGAHKAKRTHLKRAVRQTG